MYKYMYKANIVSKVGRGHPSKHVKAGHYLPSSETPSQWRFAVGPMVARDRIMAALV